MSLQRITLQPTIGSGAVAGEHVMSADPTEQTVARQSAGTCVKSPSASAPGVDSLSIPSTTKAMGVGGTTPSFSREFESLRVATEIERIEAALSKEKAEIQLGVIRRECQRANKAEKREARLRKALWAAATLAAFETMALLWVVLR